MLPMTPARAASLSPLAVLAAAPFYSVWLLYQYTSQYPTSSEALRLVLKISLLSSAIAVSLGYLLIFTYGWAARLLLLRIGATEVGWFVAVGVVPGLLFFYSRYAWQESMVPGAFFGAMVGAVYWFLAVRPSRHVR